MSYISCSVAGQGNLPTPDQHLPTSYSQKNMLSHCSFVTLSPSHVVSHPSIPGYTWYTFMWWKSDPSTPPSPTTANCSSGVRESNSAAACANAVVCPSVERSPSTRYRRFEAT